MRRNPESVVEKGQVYTLTIEGHGKQGDGIAKLDGLAIIVKQPEGPPCEIDRTYEVKITGVGKSAAFGEVIQDVTEQVSKE